MGFRACETYNLSDKFVFIEKIKVIDVVMPFNNTLIEAGKSIRHSGVDGLSYPTSNDSKQTIDIYFHSRNKER
jgi:hypothetical protein